MIINILELNHTKLSRHSFQTTVITTININSYNNKNQQQHINSYNNYFTSSRPYLSQQVIRITTYNYNFTLSQFTSHRHIQQQLKSQHFTIKSHSCHIE